LFVREMQRILANFMKDSVVRGLLLQLLYERRSEGSIAFGRLEQAVPPPGGISHRDWLRAVAQLSEHGLIDWSPLEDKSGMGLLSGFAKINDFGVKVLQGGVEPPIRISIDEARRTAVPQQEQAPIAASTQQQNITDALEKVITAINKADVSEQEKKESKSLLRKLLSSKAAAKVLGAGAQSLAAKYFKR
jgi:F0F1-type ATP synthase epsilon subunit